MLIVRVILSSATSPIRGIREGSGSQRLVLRLPGSRQAQCTSHRDFVSWTDIEDADPMDRIYNTGVKDAMKSTCPEVNVMGTVIQLDVRVLNTDFQGIVETMPS
jgi:hypothetical protein